jgi:hypothetical protein
MSKEETKPTYPEIDSVPNNCAEVDLFARRLKMKLSYIEPQLLENIVESAKEIYGFFDQKGTNLLRISRKDTLEARQTKSSLRSKSYHTCDSNSKFKKPLSRYSHHR